jgi:hypothetical protein
MPCAGMLLNSIYVCKWYGCVCVFVCVCTRVVETIKEYLVGVIYSDMFASLAVQYNTNTLIPCELLSQY